MELECLLMSAVEYRLLAFINLVNLPLKEMSLLLFGLELEHDTAYFTRVFSV